MMKFGIEKILADRRAFFLLKFTKFLNFYIKV